MALSPEALHYGETIMPRDQARNLVLHGDPNGPTSTLEIANKAALPAELSQQFGQPYVVEKILNKAAPRPALPEVEITIADTVDMSTPEAIAAEFARLQEQLKGKGTESLFGKGFVKPTEEASQQISTNAPRNATLGEEQRAIIYNHLRARTHTWAKELAEGKTPTYFIEEPTPYGVTKRVEKPVTQHLIFSLITAAKTMYQREISHAPTKPLADLARENSFDIFAVENELKKRWEKIESKKEKSVGEDTKENGGNKDTEPQNEMLEKRIETLAKEREKPIERSSAEEQVLFTLDEVAKMLKSPPLDEPNPEAGKRIKAMMEVRL